MFSEVIHLEWLAQCLTHSRYQVNYKLWLFFCSLKKIFYLFICLRGRERERARAQVGQGERRRRRERESETDSVLNSEPDSAQSQIMA